MSKPLLPPDQADSILEHLARLRLSQEYFALYLEVSNSLLSRYLRGLRPPPDGFYEAAMASLGRLEKAEEAATAARDNVLNQPNERGNQ